MIFFPIQVKTAPSYYTLHDFVGCLHADYVAETNVCITA